MSYNFSIRKVFQPCNCSRLQNMYPFNMYTIFISYYNIKYLRHFFKANFPFANTISNLQKKDNPIIFKLKTYTSNLMQLINNTALLQSRMCRFAAFHLANITTFVVVDCCMTFFATMMIRSSTTT